MAGYYGPLIMGCTEPQKPGDYVEMIEPEPGQWARILRESTLEAFIASRIERGRGQLSDFARQAIADGAHFYEVHTD